jgi:hypothetical protein
MRHLALLLPLLLACGPPADGATAGQTVRCQGEERVQLDCSSEVDYQGAKGEAGISVMQVASAQGKFEERAIRRVNEQVEQFVAAHKRACRDYNACVTSAEDYRAEASEARRRLQIIPALLSALERAESETERVQLIDRLYRGVVPDEQRVEELTFQLGMVAELPDDLGGGTFAVDPGGAVPTGARVHFRVNASNQAYLYIFQTAPSGEVSVLFPDPRIGTKNPLSGGFTARIPSEKAFRVNDKDIGSENVYVVVAREPMNDLDAALERVKSGQVSSVGDSQLLRRVAAVRPAAAAKGNGDQGDCKTRALELDDAPSGCTRTRGLMLDDASESGASPRQSLGGVPAGMQLRTIPGDDLIVTVFAFEHLTAPAYKAAGGADAPAHRTRSVSLND